MDLTSPTHLAGGSANATLMPATAGLGAAYAASGWWEGARG